MFSCFGFASINLAHFGLLSWILLGQGAGGNPLDSLLSGPWIPFLMIGVLFYVLMIRPERRKRAELSQMLANLKKNDRVITIGGIFGTVVNVQQGVEEITVKVDEGNNTKLRMQRSAIARVVTPEAADSKKNSD